MILQFDQGSEGTARLYFSECPQGSSTAPGGSTSEMAPSRVLRVDAAYGPGMQLGLSSGARSWGRHLSSLHGPHPAAAWAPSQHGGWSSEDKEQVEIASPLKDRA